MIFTSIRVIRPKDRTSPVLAFVDISMDNGIQLRDMRLMRNRDESGYVLRMPTRKAKNGVYRDIFNPISNDVRTELTNAILEALHMAEDNNVNEFTLEKETEPRLPEFSSIHVHRFPNNRQLKALASCVVDGSIVLSGIAVLLNEDTKALQLTMPNHTIVRTGGHASYYRMTQESYKVLYDDIMSAYSAAPVEDSESEA